MIDSIDKRIERVRWYLDMLPPERHFTMRDLTDALNEGTDYLKIPIRVLMERNEITLVSMWKPGREHAAVYAKVLRKEGAENEV